MPAKARFQFRHKSKLQLPAPGAEACGQMGIWATQFLSSLSSESRFTLTRKDISSPGILEKPHLFILCCKLTFQLIFCSLISHISQIPWYLGSVHPIWEHLCCVDGEGPTAGSSPVSTAPDPALPQQPLCGGAAARTQRPLSPHTHPSAWFLPPPSTTVSQTCPVHLSSLLGISQAE